MKAKGPPFFLAYNQPKQLLAWLSISHKLFMVSCEHEQEHIHTHTHPNIDEQTHVRLHHAFCNEDQWNYFQ